MKKGPANQTALDIPPAFRNDVLRSKRVIVGCGGGFHQECQQPYSPVASWMEEADVALNDEGQQYGNLDEASAIARVPRKCLVVFFFWLVAAWVKSRAERPSVSGVNRQLHVQIGCKLRIRNRKDELTKQAKRNKLQIKPEGN